MSNLPKKLKTHLPVAIRWLGMVMTDTITRKKATRWKERFRAPVIAHSQIAAKGLDRGLAVTNWSGSYQLYAWDVPSGTLSQRTTRPRGTVSGVLSPDGQFIYYLYDERGGEHGHDVRLPFAGGPSQDMTPDLPPYRSWDLCFSRAGQRATFTFQDEGHFQLCITAIDPHGAADDIQLRRHDHPIGRPALSADGRMVAVAAAQDRPHADTTVVLDSTQGKPIGGFSDAGSRVYPITFSPVVDDPRLLLTSNRRGFTRPLIWDPSIDKPADPALSELAGDVIPLD